ncbi:hypothetical protein CAEBREN_02890 [Caenorhabditis brenneri]|uniref:Uncharacterized protein n=1 Tax=Caenorhabditis brenneri TaxID=135651 RepID=G0PBD9_CAEBE|nr:hypothetical protein CAEBREN_02890 [Caenorhabditis brenneri]
MASHQNAECQTDLTGKEPTTPLSEVLAQWRADSTTVINAIRRLELLRINAEIERELEQLEMQELEEFVQMVLEGEAFLEEVPRRIRGAVRREVARRE